MPDYPLSGFGNYGGFGGEPSILDRILQAGGQILGGVLSNSLTLPGGTDIDLPGSDLGFGDPLSTATHRQTMSGWRPIPTLVVPSPDGKLSFFKSMGRPILFSGDLAATRRVARVASRAARSVGRGRSMRRRRGGR